MSHDGEPNRESASGDGGEEYYIESDRLRSFVDTVDEAAAAHEEIPDLLGALETPFRELLTDDDWLPEPYDGLVPEGYDDKGEMGGDIAQWLLYRRPEKLTLFTLVLPPGVQTPVHDHLAWGLVGIYAGAQREEFYRRVDDGTNNIGHAELEQLRTERMERGEFYELVPPNNDIHRVETASDVPSVSVHLLGADVGCIQRHQFDPDGEFVELFQSHYSNVRCERSLAPPEDHGHGHSHGH
jgi:predicted metal-dependent enzyme (double-stranded beta helix superfamily)